LCEIAGYFKIEYEDAMISQILRYKLWRDQSGQDMIEYALLVAFVCVSGVAVLPVTVMPTFLIIWSKVQCVMSTVGGGGNPG
jgi:Flp pilus assembly pilin Flp